MAKNGIVGSVVKWMVSLALLAGAIVGIAYFVHQSDDDGPDYQTVTPSRGDLTQAVTANGQLNPVLNVQVGSQISGMIQKLYVDYNSLVKSNQVVAELDPSTYKGSVDQAEGNLMSANAGLEIAQINARRAEELKKNDLIPLSDYDNTIASLHQAQAQVKINQALLDKAKVDLARCTIYAPVDGIVISRSVDVGQTVAASLSAPVLFQIANDLTKMQIDANVSEADVGGIVLGQDVNFTVDAFPTRTFHGKVSQIRNSPIVVQNVVTYDTVIEVSNKDLKLKPGMTANASIVIAQREDVLKIPNAALRYRPVETAKGPTGIVNKTLAMLGFTPKETGETNAVTSATAPAAEAERGGESGKGGKGDGGGRRGGNGSGKRRGERSPMRTVYVLSGKAEPGKALVPTAVQIKVGITDGTYTEVLDGVKEGDVLVTGVNLPVTSSKPSGPSGNPFGGGMRRF